MAPRIQGAILFGAACGRPVYFVLQAVYSWARVELPPAIVYEESGPPPNVGFVWIEGYWRPVGHHYKWVGGHWERPPYEGAYWTHPHYDHYREGWEWHEGHWDHEDHDNGHWREHDHRRRHGDDDNQGHDHD